MVCRQERLSRSFLQLRQEDASANLQALRPRSSTRPSGIEGPNFWLAFVAFFGFYWCFFFALLGYFSHHIIDMYDEAGDHGDVDGVVMANCMKPVVIRSRSVVELNQISPMVLEPATYTSEALADRYLKV